MAAFELSALASRIRERNRGRSWLLRAPVLAWMAYLFLRYVGNPFEQSLWGGINLAFHEIGHILFSPLPQFWAIAGGTLVEMAVPVVAGVLFLRQKEDFGAALALFWLATVLLGAAVYAGDARTQALPLVSPFAGAPLHDWHYILGELEILERDRTIAAILRAGGFVLMAGSIGLGGWVLGLMGTDPEKARGSRGATGGTDAMAAEELRLKAWLEEKGGIGVGEGAGGGTDRAAEKPVRDPAGDGTRGGGQGAETGSASHRGAPEPPSERPSTERALDQVKDAVDPRSLSPEERRLLEFLDRDESGG